MDFGKAARASLARRFILLGGTAEPPERGTNLRREKPRLFSGGEVAALVNLIVTLD
jgi:hypothetical protein